MIMKIGIIALLLLYSTDGLSLIERIEKELENTVRKTVETVKRQKSMKTEIKFQNRKIVSVNRRIVSRTEG